MRTKSRGRPKVPEQLKHIRLNVTVQSQLVDGLQVLADRNGIGLSAATELAISELLKNTGIGSLSNVAVVPVAQPVPVTPVTESVSESRPVTPENPEMGDELFELPPDFADFTRPTQPASRK